MTAASRSAQPRAGIGLRGQVSAIVLTGLLLSQILAAALYWVLFPRWQRELRPEAAIASITLATHLLEEAPVTERAAYSTSLSDPRLTVRWSPATGTPPVRHDGLEEDRSLSEQIAASLGQSPQGVDARTDADGRTSVTVRLHDGSLVRFLASIGGRFRLGVVEQAAVCAFFVLVLGGLWIFITWMVNAPLNRFALAAERVGRDIRSPPLKLQGPAELQRAIRAFNEMQLRLQRMIEDRTRMLGAISHDLRTPLTRLRLRVETGGLEGGLAGLLTEIDSMQTMLLSVFAFIRGVEDGESADTVDLGLLVQTVCDAICDLGGKVQCCVPGGLRFSCRPNAMMRALTNIVSNAVKYGGETQVHITASPWDEILILVEDHGPGIPDEDKEKVFEPFYRRPEALARDGSGLGLGLSIARSIILAHGGKIELMDSEPHGLRVAITLPRGGLPAEGTVVAVADPVD